MPQGSQLSAISPFKRNHLLGHGGDNQSMTSSVSSWTDKSYNPYSPAGESQSLINADLSDNESASCKSEICSNLGKSSKPRRGSMVIQRPPAISSTHSREIHRQNSVTHANSAGANLNQDHSYELSGGASSN